VLNLHRCYSNMRGSVIALFGDVMARGLIDEAANDAGCVPENVQNAAASVGILPR
jgi:sulfur transfer complex TusBCD TusB component (DsrH family)